MLIFGPLTGPRISAVTWYPPSTAGSLMTLPPSTTSTAGSVRLEPTSPASLSTVRTSSTDAFSCLPPQRTIAYTVNSLPYAGPPRDSRNQLDIDSSGLLPCTRRDRRQTAIGSILCADHKGYQTRRPFRSPRPAPPWSPDRLPGCRLRRSRRHHRRRPRRRSRRPVPVFAQRIPTGAGGGPRDA